MKYLLILITACSMLLIGCEAPAGPEGPQGPKGEQGEQGPPGVDGEDGSANVMTFHGAWNENDVQFTPDGTVAYVQFEIPELTQDVVDNAAVMAYYNATLGSTEGWAAMPISSSTMEYTYTYAVGVFELDMMSKDGSLVTTDEVIEGRVKIVIIPPGANAKINAEDWQNRVKEPGLLSEKDN